MSLSIKQNESWLLGVDGATLQGIWNLTSVTREVCGRLHSEHRIEKVKPHKMFRAGWSGRCVSDGVFKKAR